MGAGGGYGPYSTPNASGWIDVAAQIGTTGTYSLSTLRTGARGSSLYTGMCRIVSSKGHVSLGILADAGIGVHNATSIVPGIGGGGLIAYDLGGVIKSLAGVQALFVVRITATGTQSVAPVYELGIGKSF